jgi:hypothetical protein
MSGRDVSKLKLIMESHERIKLKELIGYAVLEPMGIDAGVRPIRFSESGLVTIIRIFHGDMKRAVLDFLSDRFCGVHKE